MAVYEILTALELALLEEEIQKHVRSTQYQFRVFKAWIIVSCHCAGAI